MAWCYTGVCPAVEHPNGPEVWSALLNHGRNLGPINPVLYDILGPLGAHAGISDVVSGNNSVIDPQTGQVLVQGFTAAPGFDVASGWAPSTRARSCPAWSATRSTRPRWA